MADSHFSEEALASQRRHNELVQALKRKEVARKVPVPTVDADVRSCLRALYEPVTVFAEDAAARRARLREVMVHLAGEGKDFLPPQLRAQFGHQAGVIKGTRKVAQRKAYFAESPDPRTGELLKQKRQEIARLSLKLCGERLRKQREFFEVTCASSDDKLREVMLEKAADAARNAATYRVTASHVAGERCVSSLDIACNNERVATGSWDGTVRLWNLASSESDAMTDETEDPCLATLRGHGCRVNDVAAHPTDARTFASAGADALVQMWRLDAAHNAVGAADNVLPSLTLKGHTRAVNRLAWLPHGVALVSTSSDRKVRVWDTETGACVLQQPGHSAEVYGVAAHPDGSLFVTGDLAGVCRLWDARTGRAVWHEANAHATGALISASFRADGVSLATAGQDNIARIFDIRQRREAYALAAHTHALSDVSWSTHDGGQTLLTASYDRRVCVWNGVTLELVRRSEPLEDKVTRVRMSHDGKFWCSGGFDRHVRVWRRDALAAAEMEAFALPSHG